MTSPMIPTPRQVITIHSNSSEGKGAPWTQREMSSFWLSRSNQMGHATSLTPPGAKERQQSCRLILGFISTQHFTDVFMSLIRMVLYQQSFFSPNIISCKHLWHTCRVTARGGGETPSGRVAMGLGGQSAGSWPSPDGGCGPSCYVLLHRYRRAHLPRNRCGSKPLLSNVFTQLSSQRQG